MIPGAATFGEMIFGDGIFGTIGDVDVDIPWSQVCPSNNVWSSEGIAVNSWNNQSINASVWSKQDPDPGRIIKC